MPKQKYFQLKLGMISLVLFSVFYIIIVVAQRFVSGSILDKFLIWPILIPLLLVSLPLILTVAYTGFVLDAILHTGTGYETLGLSLIGRIFIVLLAIVYYFFLGAYIGNFLSKKNLRKNKLAIE